VILADTSIWVDHLRGGDAKLVELLGAGAILTHPFVIGEIALGSLSRRDEILENLRDLPAVSIATDDEVLEFIERRALHGRGIGYVDCHLLASMTLTPGATLWTRDKRLRAVAADMGALSLED